MIPAIVQDARTRQVLMLAWMNAESLRRTLDSRETWFWSRSRRELWHKGASSGNIQKVISIRPDCDADTLLVLVDPAGPACHTGAVSCFYQEEIMLNDLFEIILDRKAHPQPGSYTNRLLDAGIDSILQKVGEESVEVILAAKGQGRQRLVEEVSDLFYHCLVLLVSQGISLEDIETELARRHTTPKEQ